MTSVNLSFNLIKNACRHFSYKAVSITNSRQICRFASAIVISPKSTASSCLPFHSTQRNLYLSSLRLDEKSSEAETGSKELIADLVKKNKVVVFMKGVPDQPMCGFSNAVVQILRMHGVEYDSHDVLDDDNLRAGIKVFSDWPTIPQIYFNGDFIGGCDILLQMHQSGDLVDELTNIGIRSALLDKK